MYAREGRIIKQYQDSFSQGGNRAITIEVDLSDLSGMLLKSANLMVSAFVATQASNFLTINCVHLTVTDIKGNDIAFSTLLGGYNELMIPIQLGANSIARISIALPVNVASPTIAYFLELGLLKRR